MSESVFSKAYEDMESYRREYNKAGQRHKKAKEELDDATHDLVDVAVRLGEAQKAVQELKERIVGRVVH